MRGLAWIAAIALWAAAPMVAAQAPMSACSARAIAEWRPAATAPMRIEAFAEGPNCAQAVAVIVVRTGSGDVVWTDAHATGHIMPLAGARDLSAMRAALADWIDPAVLRMRAASDLPEWRAGAHAPMAGEFEFYPEPWLDRDAYVSLRARNGPIYCYVQGMESIACLALDGERMFKIGVQSFPG